MIINSSEKDPVKLADWVELQILYSGRMAISLEAARSQIDKEATIEDGDEESEDLGLPEDWPENAIERFIAYGESELQRRIEIANEVYPFQMDGGRLVLKPDPQLFLPYIFCLLVSDRQMWSATDQRETLRLLWVTLP